MLDELRHKVPSGPETFDSVDRSLPSPPAPQILIRAIQSCKTVFLDFSKIAQAVSDSRDMLLEAACGLADENQQRALATAMSEFESRMIKENPANAELEINDSYVHLAHLLSDAPTERSLPWQSRLLASAQFLEHAAKPETLCQGYKIGARAICLTQKLMVTKPSRLAEMLFSAGISGKWETFDGKVITIDEHSLKPGAEEILFKAGENKRSYATKILQCLMMNNCLMRRSKPMVYSETPGRPGRGYTGQIVKGIDGEAIDLKLGATLSFLELALIAKYEFEEENCVIINSSSFAAQTPEAADLKRQKILIHINSKEELSDALLEAKNRASLPVTVAVDERRLLAESYQDGINHAINVTAFSEYGMLKIFNPQLLPGMQRVARINLQRLYNAMLSPTKE